MKNTKAIITNHTTWTFSTKIRKSRMSGIAEIRSIVLQVGNVCCQIQFTMEKQLQSKPTTKTKFTLELQKSWFYNHTKSFTHEDYANDTEFSKEYWEIKRNKFIPKVTWSILREWPPYNLHKRNCYLCLKKNLKLIHIKEKTSWTKDQS